MIDKVIECVSKNLHAATVVSAMKKDAETYIVLVDRANMDDNRAYSTHAYNIANDCLYYGHYDMSYATAVNDMNERLGRKVNSAWM